VRAAAAVAVAVVALLVGGAAGAVDPVVVVDEAGDSEDAPDIVRVEAGFGGGAYLFRVAFAGAPSLARDAQLVSILVDADLDETTGPEGTEIAVRADAQGVVLERWVDAQWHADDAARTGARYAAGVLVVTVPRAALEGSRSFEFVVVASEGDPNLEGTTDYAPELEPARFALPGARLAEVTVSQTRTRLRADVTVRLADGSRARPTSLVCTATVAGRPLRRLGTCAWSVPPAARRRVATVTVSASWEGAAAPRVTRRVRLR
jgi:hypothetical protein